MNIVQNLRVDQFKQIQLKTSYLINAHKIRF